MSSCPNCVEGRTHDVLDGDPIVETCGTCHGSGQCELDKVCVPDKAVLEASEQEKPA